MVIILLYMFWQKFRNYKKKYVFMLMIMWVKFDDMYFFKFCYFFNGMLY